MDTIINHFRENFIKDLEKIIKSFITEGKSFGEFNLELHKPITELARVTIKETLEMYDKAIKENPNRKDDFTVAVNNRNKSILTTFGEVDYSRTCYLDKATGNYLYLLDSLVGIDSNDDISEDVVIKCINEAVDSTYTKAGETCCLSDDVVSKQSVKRVIHNLNPKIILFPFKEVTSKKKLDYLYIEADEDHVDMQDGTNSIAKLVYVHEGISKVVGHASRNSLENTRYFDGTYKSNDNLWEEVLDYITAVYDLDSIKRIYISGDGASWIKSGINWIPNSKFVLDTFHMMKYVRKASAHLDKDISTAFTRSLFIADYDAFEGYSREIIELTKDSNLFKDTKLKDVIKSIQYLRNHWNGIAIKCDEKENTIGCSAEGHISHVLSSRLSSRPKGWSKHGLAIMCKLIVYKKNGGNVKDIVINNNIEQFEETINHTVKRTKNRYKSIANKYFDRLQHSIPAIRSGRKCGTYNSLAGLVNLKRVV